MAQFLNLKKTLTTTLATVGTIAAPATDKGHVVIGINVSNTHATDTTVVDVAIENEASFTYIAQNVSIPAGGSVSLLTGKIVLITNDEIHARYHAPVAPVTWGDSSGGSADLILSYLKDA